MRALFLRFRTDPHALRRVAVYVLLAAFVAQGLLAQGHRHFADVGFVVSDASAATVRAAGKLPLKGDQTKCPVCHAAAAAGAFVAPAASVLRVPSLSTLVRPRGEPAVVVERFAVHWRSRAPPLV